MTKYLFVWASRDLLDLFLEAKKLLKTKSEMLELLDFWFTGAVWFLKNPKSSLKVTKSSIKHALIFFLGFSNIQVGLDSMTWRDEK